MKFDATTRRHVLLLAVVLLATFGVRARLGTSPSIPLQRNFDSFPARFAGWTLVSQPALAPDVLAVLKADDYMVRNYVNASGREAQLFVAYYRNQKSGESMHSPKNCLPGSGWEPIVNDRISLANGAQVNRYVVENSGDREMVLYWYKDQQRTIASEYWGKFYLVWDSMRTGRRDGAIIRVLVPMTAQETIADGTRLALALANPSSALLQQFLPPKS